VGAGDFSTPTSDIFAMIAKGLSTDPVR